MFIYTKFQMPRPPQRRPRRTIPRAEAGWRAPAEAPAHGTDSFRIWTLWLGHRLAVDGARPLEGHLNRFAEIAVEAGVEPEAAAIVADARRDDVTRSRAFFTVAEALDHAA